MNGTTTYTSVVFGSSGELQALAGRLQMEGIFVEVVPIFGDELDDGPRVLKAYTGHGDTAHHTVARICSETLGLNPIGKGPDESVYRFSDGVA